MSAQRESAPLPRVRREVVSFVRRSTRMRANQLHAWERYYDDFVINVPRRDSSTSIRPDACVDTAAEFGREAPLIVEIGPGIGESLIALAESRPDCNLIAFEVYRPAIATILKGLRAAGLNNVRIIEADAAAGLRHALPPGSVSELWTFFPDPWPKARHHKRRLITSGFANLATTRLVPGGRWRLATDWADYAEQMRTVLDTQPDLRRDFSLKTDIQIAAERRHAAIPAVPLDLDVDFQSNPPATAGQDWAPRWAERPVTRFESRGIEAGRDIFDLSYVRAS